MAKEGQVGRQLGAERGSLEGAAPRLNEPSGEMAEQASADLIERIHATAPKLVMEFAGAGSRALWLLHSVAGSSRTILEATDRYYPRSLVGAVGFTPDRFTSAEVAVALAQHAAARARELTTDDGVTPTFGVGLTATIATDRTKRGEHRIELATHDAFGTERYALKLAKGARDRAGEEGVVTQLLLRAIADASGVLGAAMPDLLPGEELIQELEPTGLARQFDDRQRDWLLVTPSGELSDELPAGAAILSGSFNPVHHGHLELGRVASRRLGRPLVFELPIVNADKGEVGLDEARRRSAQFLGEFPVLLTRAPLFDQKAELIPGSTFVVGADTAERLLQTRFYDGSSEKRDAALAHLCSLRTSFLVAGRQRDDRFLTLSDLEVPPSACDLFEELPEHEFREDLASSQLRRNWPESARSNGA